MAQKNTGGDPDPRIKGNSPRRETSEFGDRQGAQQNPFVMGGDVRTLGGQGTGSSRPAMCVSHREWATWEGQGVGHAGQLPRLRRRRCYIFNVPEIQRNEAGGGEETKGPSEVAQAERKYVRDEERHRGTQEAEKQTLRHVDRETLRLQTRGINSESRIPGTGRQDPETPRPQTAEIQRRE